MHKPVSFPWALWMLLLTYVLAACARPDVGFASSGLGSTGIPAQEVQPVTLTVMAAASLTGLFEELGTLFESAHPGVKVQFNFAGSQELTQQLDQGAPADVFASANQKQMDLVIESGRVERGTSRPFAQNKLVVVFPRDNPAGIKRLEDLAKDNLKVIFAAREAPVGQYTLEFLDRASSTGTFGSDYKDRVLGNVVSYESNVKSVLAKVALGEADAGIVYRSDVTGPDAGKVGQIEIPDSLNILAAYPIAVVGDSPHPELARQFLDFVLSPAGQAILTKYGFIAGVP